MLVIVLVQLIAMVPLLLYLLRDDLHTRFLSHWLDVRSIATLDMAVSSKKCRPNWISFLHSVRSAALDDIVHSASSLKWLSMRGISVSRLQMKVDAWRVDLCDVSLLKTSDLLHIGLDGCRSVTDECVRKIATRCCKLRSIRLKGCENVTDAGISALGAGCSQLQRINLAGCHMVTDAGVIVLGARCSQLYSIDLAGCHKVTDAGVIALAAGSSQLQSINLSGCDKVTDACVQSFGPMVLR